MGRSTAAGRLFAVVVLLLGFLLPVACEHECADLAGSWKLDRMEGLETLME